MEDRLHKIEIYKELGEYERHFNQIQGIHRGLASTWLLAFLGGIAFLHSADFTNKFPVSLEIATALVSLGGSMSIALLGLLDVFVYHRLLLAVLVTSEDMENAEGSGLPRLRSAFRHHTANLHVRRCVTVFYAVPIACLSAFAFYWCIQAICSSFGIALMIMIPSGLMCISSVLVPILYGRPKKAELVVVCGLPGSGKSTVASILKSLIGASVLRSDEVRKRMIKTPKYEDDERKAVYTQLVEEAETELKDKRSVILDATFFKAEYRRMVKHAAERNKTSIRTVEVVCDEKILLERIAKRKDGPSEANGEAYRTMRDRFEKIVEPHLLVDNSGPSDGLEDALRPYF